MNTTPAAMCVTSAVKYFWMVTQSKWRSRNQEREGGEGEGEEEDMRRKVMYRMTQCLQLHVKQ